MFSFGITQYVYIGFFILLCSIVGGGIYYYKSSQAQIADLTTTVALAKVSIQTQKDTIEQMSKDTKEVQNAVVVLHTETQRTLAGVEELRGKFNKVSPLTGERDLGWLALNKPVLVEKIIDKATVNALRCMEIATGAVMTENERNEFETTGTVPACR